MGLLDFLMKNTHAPEKPEPMESPEPEQQEETPTVGAEYTGDAPIPAPEETSMQTAVPATPELPKDPEHPEVSPETSEPETPPERPILTLEQAEALQAAVNRTYPGLAVMVRDVNLTYEQAAKYEVGMILREKAHVDASCRVMGMVTSHRFAIMSNHMEKPTTKELELGPNWGLRVALPNSRFKVLEKHTYQGKTVIFLLHLPEEGWELFQNTVIDLDEELIRKCIARFEAKCLKPPIPELMMPDWIERCAFPIGMDNQGNLFPLEELGNA